MNTKFPLIYATLSKGKIMIKFIQWFKARYECLSCGHKQSENPWQCPKCGSTDMN